MSSYLDGDLILSAWGGIYLPEDITLSMSIALEELGLEASHVPIDKLKTVFDKHTEKLVINREFCKKIHDFCQRFVNRNDDHVKFFGGTTLGVHPIRFNTSVDKNTWLNDILDIDEYDVKEEILTPPSIIDPSWVRATDIMNLSCLYMTHKIFNSKLSQSEKDQALIDTLLAMQYKLMSSILSYYFPYPADEATALATYAALTKKYAIRQHGSWQRVLIARAEDVVAESSVHRRTVERFDDDRAIVYMLTDIQGRLRAMVKNICEVFYTIRENDVKIMTTGGMIELDGKMVVKDIQRSLPPFKLYLEKTLQSSAEFIKMELVKIISDVMHTMPEEELLLALQYMVDKTKTHDKDVVKFTGLILLHAFTYLGSDRQAAESMGNVSDFISKMHGKYRSARSTEETLMELRTVGERIIKKAITSKNPSVQAAVRTGLMLYIVLRTFTMKFYQ